jgi:alkylation response protein AidB-like acyl-CoA dehydrogenase
VDVRESREDQEFRDRARTWLRENRPEEERPPEGPAMRAFDSTWQRAQYDGGWAGINWPEQYGGRGLTVTQQLIWHEEYARSGAPYIGCNFVGNNHAGPTLIAAGTEAQQADHLPAILRGDAIWCQGFSEPGAGSDLASLRTRAVVDGDSLVVNGQKIWTSYADVADVQELLVRTDPDAPKHRGISWVICDMSTPGIEVRPLGTIVGVNHFAEVFYDDVHIPLTNVVGQLNDGWRVAMSTLSFERGTAFIRDVVEMVDTVEELVRAAHLLPAASGSGRAIDDAGIRVELGRLRADVAALAAMNSVNVSRVLREGSPGPRGSMLRLHSSLLLQRLHRVALDVIGPGVLADQPPVGGDPTPDAPWPLGYLNSFRATIAAGTKDIQRTIIGERVLGLPRGR